MRAPAPLFLLAALLGAAVFAQDMDGEDDGMGGGMGGEMGGAGGKASARVDFAAQVRPILEANCFKCHATEYKGRKKRPKGSLRLDHKPGILAVVIPGLPDKSALYTRCSLPADHEDIMPPDADPLAPAQVATLRAWIEQGARFGDEPADAPLDPAAASNKDNRPRGPSPFAVYDELARNASPAPGAGIERARAAGARVTPVVPGSPLLRVEFPSDRSKVDDETVRELAPLRRHVAILSLSGTSITDRALDEIAKMPRLVRLDLPRTKITDKGLATLAKARNPELRRLNLYATGVTTKGVAQLVALPKLEEIFLWKANASDAAALRALLPDVSVHAARELPAPPQAGGAADRRRRRR